MGKVKEVELREDRRCSKTQIAGVLVFRGNGDAICGARKVHRRSSFTVDQSHEFHLRHISLVPVTHPRGDVMWAAGDNLYHTQNKIWARNRNVEVFSKATGADEVI